MNLSFSLKGVDGTNQYSQLSNTFGGIVFHHLVSKDTSTVLELSLSWKQRTEYQYTLSLLPIVSTRVLSK